jgi:hypothetical protein
VVGVLEAFDLRLIQYLRLISGANTLVPSEDVARSLEALGYDEATDDHAVLARAEELALHLELPAPVVGEMLEDLAREGRTDFPEPPREAAEPEEPAEEAGDEASAEGVASEGGEVEGGAAAEAREEKPSPEDRADRTGAGEDPGRGEEPTRVQDSQAKDAPSVDQEAGDSKDPDAPETGRDGAPGASDREDGA